ncbi:MAG: zinc-ribbon domain-containing protein [Thermoplasmatota archaeon]
MECKNCGSEIYDDVEECPKCGYDFRFSDEELGE